ncbi:MAG: hypothetical protein JST42_25405 [Bacteroidetes bacterium]|nr:hypothetical protein [Bacteroidota bacterium]
MRSIKNCTRLMVIAACFSACGTAKRNLQSGVQTGIDRVLAVPAMVSHSLEDAAKTIYVHGGLKDGTTVTIEHFDAEFYGRQDSFPIRMNNIQFYRSGDSVHYENFHFPGWDTRKYADTMRSRYRCSYRVPGSGGAGCLSGAYSVMSGKIERVAAPGPCAP